jgi:hypothetical protein
MKIFTNNLRDFKKNSLIETIDEEKYITCRIEIPTEPYILPNKIGFKNTKIFEQNKNNAELNEKRSNFSI